MAHIEQVKEHILDSLNEHLNLHDNKQDEFIKEIVVDAISTFYSKENAIVWLTDNSALGSLRLLKEVNKDLDGIYNVYDIIKENLKQDLIDYVYTKIAENENTIKL